MTADGAAEATGVTWMLWVQASRLRRHQAQRTLGAWRLLCGLFTEWSPKRRVDGEY